jgi:hypothetical protein
LMDITVSLKLVYPFCVCALADIPIAARHRNEKANFFIK